MTDHHDPDELASAHLDGDTSPEEAARAAADPTLLERVEALREVRAAIRQPVPVDAEARDAAIAAALDAFDEQGTAGTAPGTVTPISPRRTLSPTARRVLGAAAVAAVVALLVPLLARSGDDDQSADATFRETGAAIGDGGEAEAGAGDAQSGADRALTSTTEMPAPATALGTYDDVDDLVEALDQDDLRFAPRADDGASSPEERAASDCSIAGVAGATQIGVAVVAGRDVVVALLRDDDLRLLVIDAATCEVVADREL